MGALEQSIGGLTGVCQHFHIGGEVCQRELRQTMLPLPEEVTGTPELQILLCYLKAGIGTAHGAQPHPGVRALGVGDQNTGGGHISPADPPPELVQLAEAEPLGIFDEHYDGVRHIDPDFHHSGGHQQVDLSGLKAAHNFILVGSPHFFRAASRPGSL